MLARLKPLLEDSGVLKIAQNLKYDYLIFLQRGIRIAPFDDTMLISYVLDAALHGHGMDELSELHLSHKPIAFSEVAGKGKDKITFDCVPVKEATRYSAEDADVTLRLHALLKPRLVAEGKRRRLRNARTAAGACAGRYGAGRHHHRSRSCCAGSPTISRSDMAALEKEIHKLAGGTFNIGSPKQLGDILFGKFKLEGGRKTKTGAWSTDADVLEEVAAQGHDIAKKVLDWRQLQKLRGTYTDALPAYINPKTGRVHTSYAMASTSTGRLASTDPNLQNIPIRTEEGRRIRAAFIARQGHEADQRRLQPDRASAAGPYRRYPGAEKSLCRRSRHSRHDGVGDFRRAGQRTCRPKCAAAPRRSISASSTASPASAWPTSWASRAARPTITSRNISSAFPASATIWKRTKAFAREQGFVETLFGRRIHIREINSKIPGLRGGAERAAINAPIQGAAADIIRRAMIRVPRCARESEAQGEDAAAGA